MLKNKQTFIQGQFLHAGIVGKKCNLVAMFATLQMEFNHKIFYSNKKTIDRIAKICGFKANRAYTLIRECVEWGIIVELNDHRGGHRLLSNLELSEKFGGSKFTKSYLTHEVLNMGIKASVKMLKMIPAYSSLKAQAKEYEKNKDHRSNSENSIDGRPLTIKGHQKLLKAQKKGLNSVSHSPVVSLSNKVGSKKCGISERSFIKYKYDLETMGAWCVKRRCGVLLEEVPIAEWEFIKNDLAAHNLPHYAKYNPFTRKVEKDLACEFIFTKYA